MNMNKQMTHAVTLLDSTWDGEGEDKIHPILKARLLQ